MRVVDFEHGLTKKVAKYVRSLQRVFSTHWFGSSGEKRNSFVLFSGGAEEDGGQWSAQVLLLFRIVVAGSN